MSLLPRCRFERGSWQIPIVVFLSQCAQFQWLTAKVSLITPAKRVENHGSPWLVSGNSSAPVHALLPHWCVPVRWLRIRTSPYWQNCVNIGLILHHLSDWPILFKNCHYFTPFCLHHSYFLLLPERQEIHSPWQTDIRIRLLIDKRAIWIAVGTERLAENCVDT